MIWVGSIDLHLPTVFCILFLLFISALNHCRFVSGGRRCIDQSERYGRKGGGRVDMAVRGSATSAQFTTDGLLNVMYVSYCGFFLSRHLRTKMLDATGKFFVCFCGLFWLSTSHVWLLFYCAGAIANPESRNMEQHPLAEVLRHHYNYCTIPHHHRHRLLPIPSPANAEWHLQIPPPPTSPSPSVPLVSAKTTARLPRFAPGTNCKLNTLTLHRWALRAGNRCITASAAVEGGQSGESGPSPSA